jgi:AcrR family transcriptional regulator
MPRSTKSDTATATPHTALSRDVILDTALRIVDDEGLGAVSMRAVATRLGVTPMALYFHVGSKAELLDAVIHRVVAKVQLPQQADAAWDELLLAFAQSGRRELHAHPGVAAAIIAENPSSVGEPGLRLGERIYAAMQRAGFVDADMAVGFYTVMVFLLGFVAMETPRHPTPLAEGERDAMVERMEGFFASLPAADFPEHVRLAPELARMTTEEQFDSGVAVIIAGLRARLSTPSEVR